MFKEGWLLKGCLRGWLFEAMPANQEMEQAILDNAKLDKNIEDLQKMLLLTKEECKGLCPQAFSSEYTCLQIDVGAGI